MKSHIRRKFEEWKAYAEAARSSGNELLKMLADGPEISGPLGVIDFGLVRFTSINEAALSQFSEWNSEYDFPWHDAPEVIQKDPRHLDLALWYDDLLCGLCFATPSGKRTKVRIMLLEGMPRLPYGPHPLKQRVIGLCVLAVSQYCKIIGATLIEVDKPLQNAILAYQQNDFDFENGALVLHVATE
ncbi:hypothetical protein [Pseudomonas syringae]|uniref:N-acetyltransferase domain-containing protein n=1 Tax=Pseudomonas syringae pv. aceris TaxID=199198 RepID=A0A0P9HAZ7_PSESX|nr:hypothetical protein [Pseudomonas syringae]KPW15841.1 Uncharacterized protein ALO91_04007 [Pseudomonas syringae pv. aceris]